MNETVDTITLSTLKLKHPFIEGLPGPLDHKKEIAKVKSWISTQPHLPEISDEFIYLFLHACYYSVDKARTTIENYFTCRANNQFVFGDRDVYSDKMQILLTMANLMHLPKRTPEGYRIVMYSVKNPDPTKFVFNDSVKGFLMYNDCVLSEYGIQEGYVAILDMKGVSIGHLARVSLPALKCVMSYMQEAHPIRLKAIHILNTASWIHHIMRMVLPLIKSEYLNLLKFHKGNAPEDFPIELLPRDYGGDGPSVEEMDKATHQLVDKYAEWLKESEYFKANEAKRVRKSSWWGLWGNTSTTKLDEKTILKNLQID